MLIPLVDLKAQYEQVKQEVRAAIEGVFDQMHLFLGPQAQSFEEEFAAYSKNLGAYGEAGICVTNNGNLAESMRMLRDHGSRERYHHELLGANARLDELQAAILRVKMPYLDQWNAARQAHARSYTDQLQGAVAAVPVQRSWASHVFYVYVVQVLARIQDALQSQESQAVTTQERLLAGAETLGV